LTRMLPVEKKMCLQSLRLRKDLWLSNSNSCTLSATFHLWLCRIISTCAMSWQKSKLEHLTKGVPNAAAVKTAATQTHWAGYCGYHQCNTRPEYLCWKPEGLKWVQLQLLGENIACKVLSQPVLPHPPECSA
jgi:hypothetical protein